MADWIQDALRLLQHIASQVPQPGKPCREQSKILRGTLDHVCRLLEQVQEVSLDLSGVNTKHKLAAVGEDVKCVILLSSRLITSYDKDDWVMTALLSQDSREDFKCVFWRLYDTIELVSGFLLETSNSERDKSTIREAYSSCLTSKPSMNMLELAARNDRIKLMRMVMPQEDNSHLELGSEVSLLQLLWTMLAENRVPPVDESELYLKRHLNQGGHGTVYEACWMNRVDVAVKVLASGETSFRREVAVLHSCRHPNISRIFGYFYESEKQQHSLVMEKMDMDLGDYMKRNPSIPTLDCVLMLLEIANGMAWLHSKDVIHRDLKPQNILVASRDDVMDVRIADFGISRTGFVTSRVSFASPNLGTVMYMAPEMWHSERYSRKSDVFSFAMICYQMLTGRMPFEKEMLKSRDDHMLQVCNGMRPLDLFPESCPVELAELTRRCWSGEASARPFFSEVCETLKQVKVKLLTNVEDWAEVKRRLLSSSSQIPSAHHNNSSTVPRTREQTSKPRLVGCRAWILHISILLLISGLTIALTNTDWFWKPIPSSEATSKEKELLELVQRGQVLEAFQQALALNDPKTLWWLAGKVDHTVMQTFDEKMVFSTAGQLTQVMSDDPIGIFVWLDEAQTLLIHIFRVVLNSVRLEKMFGEIVQGLNGMIAITPKDSELAEVLQEKLRDYDTLFQTVEIYIRDRGPAE